LVVSDAVEFLHSSSEDIVSRVLADLRKVIPDVPAPRHASVVWERQATPTPTPAFWNSRPGTSTPIKNLFLAGDWVDTGLPPTIESACRSGHLAAAAAKKYLEERSLRREPSPC
jgi:uncharacterized protein with NAD-binding domain and iron-sulfur cluster